MPGLRVVGRAFLVVFAISTAFPVLALFGGPYGLPSYVGILDVGVAGIAIVAGLTLESRAREHVTESDRATAWRWLRAVATLMLGLLALFFIAPRFAWDVLAIGLVWRTWLLVWAMPALVASLRQPS